MLEIEGPDRLRLPHVEVAVHSSCTVHCAGLSLVEATASVHPRAVLRGVRATRCSGLCCGYIGRSSCREWDMAKPQMH
jgi:uncharacterized ferredoxin-like protein